MKNFSTWLLVMFVVMFWIFRIIIAFAYETNMNFAGIVPINQQMEIILLFVVLLCIILIVKRKIIGALIYLLAYGMYFGTTLIEGIKSIVDVTNDITNPTSYLNTFIALIGIILPIAVLLDLLLDKNRKANPKDGKTDWFYNNKDFDRNLDERADKNNYRTM